jgi:hypothetical protein
MERHGSRRKDQFIFRTASKCPVLVNGAKEVFKASLNKEKEYKP